MNDSGGDVARDDAVQELRIALHLANRQLSWTRDQLDHAAESLARMRRRRTALRDQVDALTEALAETLSAAYWEEQRPTGLLRRSSASEEADQVREVEASDLFDGAWYLRKNAGAVRDRTAPAVHYVRRSRHTDPGPDFSATTYLAAHPDAARAGLPLLVHAVRNGWQADGARSSTEAEAVSPTADVHV